METFAIAPGSAKTMWVLVAVVGLVVAVALGVLVLSALGSRSSRFVVEAGGLRLKGDLYGRFVPVSQLRMDEARILDLSEHRELQPKWRTLGTAVPGYRAGWFRLRNGEKALLYLTDQSRAVYLPTTAGYSLLLSPREPDRFVQRLRSLTP